MLPSAISQIDYFGAKTLDPIFDKAVFAGLGANAVFGNMRTGLEWRVPLHSDLNGVQLERDHAITVTVSRGF